MEQRSTVTEKWDRWSFLWLALAAIFALFINGNWNIPLATWLSLLFTLRFWRTQPPRRGFIIYTFVFMVPLYFAWQGLMPVPHAAYFLFVAVVSLSNALAFLTDRLLVSRLTGFVSTLVFPLVMVTTQYVMTLTSPYSSFGSLAYTQYGNLPLLQTVSVAGLSGITFLLAWFASTVNWAWEQQFRWKEVWKGLVTYAGVLAVSLLAGGAALVSTPASDTVRAAAVPATEVFEMGQDIQDSAERFLSGEATDAEVASIRAEFSADNEHLLERCKREARAGASIIFWSEGGSLVLKEDEAALVERGCTLARQEGVYLGMALATLRSGESLVENKVVLIEPSGEVAWEYIKSRPRPGESSMRGVGEILTLDTPYGRIAAAICFDMDFPDLIHQAGAAGVDVMFNPSNDWEEVAHLRMQMATFRAIENGFSLVRPTSHGFSIATDYRGRVLGLTDYFRSEDPVMIAYVPTEGVTTVYSQIGDVFAWLCMAGFVAMIARVLVRHRRTKSPRTPTS